MDFVTPRERRNVYIRKIRNLPSQVQALVNNLSEEQLTITTQSGEWTISQIVHHIADSHMMGVIRMKLTLTEDRPVLPAYNQEAWAELADAKGASIQTTLRLLEVLHQRWGALLGSVQESDWQRTAVHPMRGEMTMDDLLEHYVRHGENHLVQIERTLTALRS